MAHPNIASYMKVLNISQYMESIQNAIHDLVNKTACWDLRYEVNKETDNKRGE